MITFSYILTMVLITGLTAILDMVLFQFSFWEALSNIVDSEVFYGRLFVISGVLIGFAFSITSDIRLFLGKRKGYINKES
ncbi:hypothetical protein AM500_16480 [Bacillus sp. FJAT-18017]|uniref:hypothetical protein n=1 Tax=Bacillus sp. FJAT-18017 TaxID=1705566 RepID=UPI0006AF5878|nr:hypothetical protein [Bacillus sp. FJAT-18017]ALC91216.1 hypothetical protein AM500_16480 [Bacillus sp. FJAT-18017]